MPKTVSIPDRYAKNADTATIDNELNGFQFLIGTLKTNITLGQYLDDWCFNS